MNININLLYYVFSNFFLRGVGFLTQALLILFITVEELGIVRISFGYIEILKIVSALGLTTALIKVNSSENLSSSRENTLYAMLIILLVGGVSSFGVFAVSYYGGMSNNEEVNNQLMVLSFYSTLFSLAMVLVVDFQVRDRFKQLSVIQIKTKLLGFFSFLFLSYFFGLTGYFLSLYFTAFLTLIYMSNGVISIKSIKSLSFDSFNVFLRKVKSIAFYSFTSNLLGTFNKYIPLLILSYTHFNEKEMGFLGIALTVYIILDIITSSVQQYFLPKLSAISNDREEWLGLYKKTQKRFISFSLLVSVFVCVVMFFGVTLVFKEYSSIILYMFYLATAWFLSSFYTIKGALFISNGNPEVNMYCGLINLPIVLIFSYAFINSFGVYGVVYAKIVQVVSLSIIYCVAYRIKIKQ